MHEARVATGRLNTALPLVTSIYNTRCMVYVTGRSNQCCHSALASNRGFSRTQVHEKLGWCSRRGGAWIKMPRSEMLMKKSKGQQSLRILGRITRWRRWAHGRLMRKKGCDVYLSVVTVIPDTTSCARTCYFSASSSRSIKAIAGSWTSSHCIKSDALLVLFLLLLLAPLKSFQKQSMYI